MGMRGLITSSPLYKARLSVVYYSCNTAGSGDGFIKLWCFSSAYAEL